MEQPRGILLTTERLVLRDHRSDDLPSHHALLSDLEAMVYLQDIATHSMAESEKNLRTAMAGIGRPNRKYYFLRIENRWTGEHIGETGYTVSEWTPAGKFVDVGYFLRPCCWGRGYAAEALREIVRFAFEEDEVFRLSCGCNKENTASERVMQKAGLIWEYERKQCVWHDGHASDRVGYRLLREEWLSGAAR